MSVCYDSHQLAALYQGLFPWTFFKDTSDCYSETGVCFKAKVPKRMMMIIIIIIMSEGTVTTHS
jgi:hypothetical protein